jgi:REP element-mobilizing transposase RayT
MSDGANNSLSLRERAAASRKLVKHYHEPGDLHELTFYCYKRQPLLTSDAWRHQLACCIDAAGDEFEMRLAAFVFMPEHLHLLSILARRARLRS